MQAEENSHLPYLHFPPTNKVGWLTRKSLEADAKSEI